MKTFTIIREKWARGGKGGPSALLNSQGNMCCLGFFALAVGASKEQIQNKDAPSCLVRSDTKWRKILKGLVPQRAGAETKHTRLGYSLMSTNDMPANETDREAKLTRLFAKIGWKPVYK